jgi:hypothetical protein
MVGNAGQLPRCRLGRQDRKPSVDLEGIRSHNLTPEALGQPEGEVGFAGPRGAGNDDGFRGYHGNGRVSA